MTKKKKRRLIQKRKHERNCNIETNLTNIWGPRTRELKMKSTRQRQRYYADVRKGKYGEVGT